MSTPYQFTPRVPAPPHSTPLSASGYVLSKHKTARAPIHNPYDKFTQPEFDIWIGGITGALRRALGQEEEEQAKPSEKDPAESASDDFLPKYSQFDVGDQDEVADDSFAEIKARRVVRKGKARDPREGPGLGGGGLAQPIEIISSDEEDEEEVQELAVGTPDESDEEEENDEEIQEEEEEEEEEEGEEEEIETEQYSEEENTWDQGESSSRVITSAVKIGPPTRSRRKEVEEAAKEEEYYEEYDEEYEEEEEDADADHTERPKGAAEAIDIVSDDEEEIKGGGSVWKQTSNDIIDHEDEESEGEEGYDEYSDGVQEKQYAFMQPERKIQSFAAIRRPRDASDDEEEEEDEGVEEAEEEQEELVDDDEEIQEVQALPNDTSFPLSTESLVLRSRLQPENSDPWSGPRTYAQDFYSGGDLHLPAVIQVDSNYTDPLEVGSTEVYDDRESAIVYESQETHWQSNQVGEIQPLDEDTSFPHHKPEPEAVVEIPDTWEGPQTYAEDFYSEGDVRTLPGMQVDPNLLSGTADEDSGIDTFLTPSILTPRESDMRSGSDDEEQEIHPPVVTTPFQRNVPVPLDTEIIMIGDSDEDQGEDDDINEGSDVQEEFNELDYDEDKRTIERTQDRSHVVVYEDEEEEEEGQEVVPPLDSVAKEAASPKAVYEPIDSEEAYFASDSERMMESHTELLLYTTSSSDLEAQDALALGNAPSLTSEPFTLLKLAVAEEEEDLSMPPDAACDNMQARDQELNRDFPAEAVESEESRDMAVEEASKTALKTVSRVDTSIETSVEDISPITSGPNPISILEPESFHEMDDIYASHSPETTSASVQEEIADVEPEVEAVEQTNDVALAIVERRYPSEEQHPEEIQGPVTAEVVMSDTDIRFTHGLDEDASQPVASTSQIPFQHPQDRGHLPTPPSEGSRIIPLPEVDTYISAGPQASSTGRKVEMVEVSDDEDTNSQPAFADALDLIIEVEDTELGDNAMVYEIEDGFTDEDAEGEVEPDDVEILSVSSASDGWQGDRSEDEGYVVEEPLTEGRLTEEPPDRAMSIGVVSVGSSAARADSTHDAIPDFEEPGEEPVTRPEDGPSVDDSTTKDLVPLVDEGLAEELPLSINEGSPFPVICREIPMPITANEDVIDLSGRPNTPPRQRNFILSLPGTPNFVLSPINTPRPAGEAIPVSISVPPSVLRALRQQSQHPPSPGPSMLYPPASTQTDGLFTPAEPEPSTMDVSAESANGTHEQILDGLNQALFGISNLPQQYGLDQDSPKLTSRPPGMPDQLLPTVPSQPNVDAFSVEDTIYGAPDLSVHEVLSDVPGLTTIGDIQPTSPSPSSLPQRTPSGFMGVTLSRKSTDPILMADPYPYCLSTPGSALSPDQDEGSEEEAGGDNSMSSHATLEKLELGEDPFDLPDFGEDLELQYPADLESIANIAPNNTILEQDAMPSTLEDNQATTGARPPFEEILNAEDPFKLMGSDSTVAPMAVKDDEGPKQYAEITVGPKHSMTDNDLPTTSVQATSSADTVTQQWDSSTPAPPSESVASGSSKQASKRKRDPSPDFEKRLEILATKGKGRKGSKTERKGKRKATAEPSPNRPVEETIHVRPRPKPHNDSQEAAGGVSEFSSRTHTSLGGGVPYRMLQQKTTSRASSVASSAPSDKSLVVQSSPTTNKPNAPVQAPQPLPFLQPTSLFHAHGQKRKNLHHQPQTIAQQMQTFRPQLPPTSISHVPVPLPTLTQSQPSPPSHPPIITSTGSAPLVIPATSAVSGVSLVSHHPIAEPHTDTNTEAQNTAASPPTTPRESILPPAPPKSPGSIIPAVEPTFTDSPEPPASPVRQLPASVPPSTTRATRSQCRYHRISLPKEEGGPRVCFLVPGCSLNDRELMQEEEIEDHGDATYEDSLRMIKDIETLDFNQYLIGTLRQLVGLDLLREQEVFYLPQPGEELSRKVLPRRSISERQALVRVPGDSLIYAGSGSPASASNRPPVSNADSTSTSISIFRKLAGSEKASTVALTDSESETSDDEKPHTKRIRHSPPGEHAGSSAMIPLTNPKSKAKAKPRKSKTKDVTWQPTEGDDDSSQEKLSKKGRKSATGKRGVKRTRTTEVLTGVDGGERKSKKLKVHVTAPGALSMKPPT